MSGMKYIWDQYLGQFSEDYLQAKSLREHLEGFFRYLESRGALFYSGEGYVKVLELENQNRELKEALRCIDKQIESLKMLRADIEENRK